MRITRLPHKLRRFGELSLADKWLLLRAVFWLGVARIWLAAVPFQRLVERLSSEPEAADVDPRLLERIGYAVGVAGANVPWRSDCFPQAIAAQKLLRGYGYAGTVHFGVDRVGEDDLLGHAWVTCKETVVVGGEDLDRYTEMLPL